jgi:phosphoglycolate phosphatase-like HAD superfamily hydrolase
MPIKNILFDFDGVILDSMPIRDSGFAYLFKEYPEEQVTLLLNYHRNNGGLSRYHKIRYFYENILGKSITEEEVMVYAGRFSDIMRQQLLDPKLIIHDTIDFIKANYERFPMHVVSGSDGNELRWLCEQLGIATYFLSIEGSPTPKIKLVEDLLAKYEYQPAQTVLIGDSINDFDAAQKNNIEFLGYRYFSDTSSNNFTHLQKMEELLKYC